MIDASAAASLAAGPGQTAPGDFWIGWRRQIDALASAGFRVIVPDQRGYNTSDKPKAIREYTLPKLVGVSLPSPTRSASEGFTSSVMTGAVSSSGRQAQSCRTAWKGSSS
ncbi:alpha/beta hydrolase [Mesorhizobium sp. M0036]